MHERGDTNPPVFLQHPSLFPKNSLPIPFLASRTTKQFPRAGFEASNTLNSTLKPQWTETFKFKVLVVASFASAQCPGLTGTSSGFVKPVLPRKPQLEPPAPAHWTLSNLAASAWRVFKIRKKKIKKRRKKAGRMHWCEGGNAELERAQEGAEFQGDLRQGGFEEIGKGGGIKPERAEAAQLLNFLFHGRCSHLLKWHSLSLEGWVNPRQPHCTALPPSFPWSKGRGVSYAGSRTSLVMR